MFCIKFKKRLALIASLCEDAQIRIFLAQLADHVLDFLKLLLCVPRDPAVRDQKLDKAFHVNLGSLDNHLLRVVVIHGLAMCLLIHALEIAAIQDVAFERKRLKRLSAPDTHNLCSLVVNLFKLPQDVIRVLELKLFVSQPLVFAQNLGIVGSHVLCHLRFLESCAVTGRK